MPAPQPQFSNPFGGLVQGILGPTAAQRGIQFDQQKYTNDQAAKNAQGQAYGQVMQKLGGLLESGVQPQAAFQKMLNDPSFIDAFASGADPQKMITDAINFIQTQNTPAVKPNLGIGEAPVTQLPGQAPQYGAPNMPFGAFGNSAQERAAAWLVQNGKLSSEDAQKYILGTIQVQPKRDAYNNPIGWDVIDTSTGQIKNGFPATPETNSLFQQTPGGGQGPAPGGQGPQPAQGQGGQTSLAPGAQGQARGQPGQPGQVSAQASGVDPVVARRRAISAIESGGPDGNYHELGPLITNKKSAYFGDRAYGRYQVMGKDIPAWTQEALGKSLSIQEFLTNPHAQDMVFDHFFGKYEQQYGGPDQAASVWFTGQPINPQSASASDAQAGFAGMNGNQYVQAFVSNLANETGGKSPVGQPKGQGPLAWQGPNAPQVNSKAPSQGQVDEPGRLNASKPGIITNPADMLLGFGALPAAAEAAGGLAGQVDPALSGEEQSAYRNAIRGYRNALGALANSGRISADYKTLQGIFPDLGPFANPVNEGNKMIQVYDKVTSMQAQAIQDVNNQFNPPDVKVEAAKDIAKFQTILSQMPPRQSLVDKITQIKAGTGGQLTPQKAIEGGAAAFQRGAQDVQNIENGVLGNAPPQPTAPTTQTQPVDRSKQIMGISNYNSLRDFVRKAGAMTDSERAAVLQRSDQLISGGGQAK